MTVDVAASGLMEEPASADRLPCRWSLVPVSPRVRSFREELFEPGGFDLDEPVSWPDRDGESWADARGER